MPNPRSVALLTSLLCAITAGCAQASLPNSAGSTPVPDWVEQSSRVMVDRVVDGDTVDIADGTRVRILTVDTPERGDCGFREATDALSGLLPAGTLVAVTGLKSEPDRDRYGRRLANLHVVRDGADVHVSLWLAEHGWALVYTDYPTADTGRAQQAQDAAQEAGAGLWALCPDWGRG